MNPATNNPTPDPSKAAMTAMQAARQELLQNRPFFAYLLATLRLVVDATCGTAYTDGKVIGFNPMTVLRWAIDHRLAVLCHEVLHVALGHCWRRGDRDRDRWNRACDYVVNALLISAGFRLPKGALYAPRFDGKGAEVVYRILETEEAQQAPEPDEDPAQGNPGEGSGGSGGAGSEGPEPEPEEGDQEDPNEAPAGSAPPSPAGSEEEGETSSQDPAGGEGVTAPAPEPEPVEDHGELGEVRDFPSGEETPERAEAEARWAEAVHEAADVAEAEGRGNLPGGFARALSNALPPRQDWRAVLAAFCQEQAPTDYNFRRGDRRFPHTVIPTLSEESCPPLVAVIDTSGSIGARELGLFQGQLQEILDQVRPRELVVVYADADVNGAPERYEPGDILRLRPRGGGGTDFRPAIRWALMNEPDAVGILYFTDGEGPAGAEPPIPLLWILVQRIRMPWGESCFVY